MSGRHRKQSESGSIAGKAALSGIALSGAGMWFASTAEAATDADWDRVASCESGNNWHINTGNGFQGGLQFSPSTWSGHGGGQFASAANLATREQQIVIAERVLSSQGRGAWPVCGRGLGTATLRDAPAPKAPEKLQPRDTAPDIVAVADVERDSVTDGGSIKSITSKTPVTMAGFSTIGENLQIGPANDLRAPAPDADLVEDAFADEAEAPVADVMPIDEDVASDVETAQDEDVAPAENDVQAVEAGAESDSLGAFVLAAKNKGIEVSV